MDRLTAALMDTLKGNLMAVRMVKMMDQSLDRQLESELGVLMG